jgi:group I intron endonuclease
MKSSLASFRMINRRVAAFLLLARLRSPGGLYGVSSMKSGIYAIVNTVNGKRYVGSALNFRKRWGLHRHNLRAGKHHSPHLQKAWNKYGESAFVFSILEFVHPEFLLEIEQKYINVNRGGYNIAKIAGTSMLGKRHRPETIKKMRAARALQKILPPSQETIEKRRAANTGKKRSSEYCAKRREAMKGKSPSEKCIAAARLKNLGRKLSDETRSRMSASRIGRVIPREQIERFRAKRIGHSVSLETRAKISRTLKAKKRGKSCGVVSLWDELPLGSE